MTQKQLLCEMQKILTSALPDMITKAVSTQLEPINARVQKEESERISRDVNQEMADLQEKYGDDYNSRGPEMMEMHKKYPSLRPADLYRLVWATETRDNPPASQTFSEAPDSIHGDRTIKRLENVRPGSKGFSDILGDVLTKKFG